MRSITANNLQAEGIKAIEQALLNHSEVAISVDGSNRCVVMTPERYQHLRECELDAALAQSGIDIEVGRAAKEPVAVHLARIDNLNRSAKKASQVK
ncbi:MAG: hypothetical protein LRY49_10575 [Burkholderiaceae bacterium]|nr:hypothetical protein [Burkholderiaceae bacterium]